MKTLRLLFLLTIALLTLFAASGANNLYRVLADETGLYKEEKGPAKDSLVHRGDTLAAYAATHKFLEAHRDTSFERIPLEYNGMRGWVDYDLLYPIRAEETDTLEFFSTEKIKDRPILQRDGVEILNWALNRADTPVRTIYSILIMLAFASLCLLVARKTIALRLPALIGGALAMIFVSYFEILFFLANFNNPLWFVTPNAVGWWKAIFDFIAFTAVIALQAVVYYQIWAMNFVYYVRSYSFDFNLYFSAGDTFDKMNLMALYPLVLGVILLVMNFLDNGKWTVVPYAIAVGTLCICAIAGLIFKISRRQLITGLIFAIYYIAAGLGLTLAAMFYAASLLVVIVVVIVIAIGIGILASLGGGSSSGSGRRSGGSGPRVKFTTKDGRIHQGRLNDDHTISGDDGKTYTLK